MTRQEVPATKWELLRMGKFTSSEISPLLVSPKDKSQNVAEGAKTYIYEKAAEIVTGTVRKVETYAMEWGNEHEPTAAFILKQKFPGFEYFGKQEPRFFAYTDFSGGSPDGVSRAEKIVGEIKCPENPSNHVEFCLLNTGEDLKKFDKNWWHQIQMNIACVAKAWGVSPLTLKGAFISFCPLVKKELYRRYHIIMVEPCPIFLEALPGCISRATTELANTINKLKKQTTDE